jgi:DNA gyrase subunit A
LIDASERNGPVVDIRFVNDTDEVMLITDKGQTLRTRVAEIRETGRNAQGVKIMSVETDERVSGVERIAQEPPGGSEMPPHEDGGSGDGGSIPPPAGETPQPPSTDDDKSLN